MKNKQRKYLSIFVLVALTACTSGPSARIKGSDEGDLIGDKKAGAATYNTQVPEAVDKLLEGHRAANPNSRGTLTLCVLGVDNQSAENLLDWEEQLYQLITNSINQSGSYTTISRRTVDRALSEGGLRQDDLLLPRYRKQFAEILEKNGDPVALLLFPKLTTGTTDSGRKRQRDYLLTLELIDIASGAQRNFSAPIAKEYER